MSAVDNSVLTVLSDQTLVVLHPEQTVRDAATLLSTHRIGAAPVLVGDDLAGVFTERDVLKKVVAAGRNADATSVGEVMTRKPQTVTAESSLVHAFALMIEGEFRHLPVVGRDGKVIAMLSMRDIPPEHRIMHRQWTEWTNGKLPSEAVA